MTASIIIGERTVAELDLKKPADLSRAFRLVIAMKNPRVTPKYYPDYFVVSDESNNLRLYVNEE